MKQTGILLIFGGLVCASHASPTMLHAMPIADILRHREVLIGTTMAGVEHNIDKKVAHSNAGTVGLFDRIEIGWANDYEKTTSFDAKVLIFENDKGALSAGFMSWRGKDIDPYVVGRADFGQVRLHAGWMRQGGISRGMVGVDWGLSDSLTFMADHLTGPGCITWAGFCWAVPKLDGLGVTVALGIPGRKSDGIQAYMNFAYGFRF